MDINGRGDPTLQQLRCFAAVADCLHFTRAAQALNLAQPHVSREITRLERELGFRLFERTTREVRLTPGGSEFHRHVRLLFRHLDDARSRARAVSEGTQGTLVAAFAGSVTYSWLPRLSQAFLARYPKVDLDIRSEMLTGAQVQALADGGIDVGLLRPPVGDAGIDTFLLDDEPLVAAVPDGHEIGGSRTPITVDQLAGDRFVGYRGMDSTTNRAMLETCLSAGFLPNVARRVPDTHSLVALVAAGVGVALVPGSTRHFTVRGVTYLPLANASIRLPLLLAWRRSEESPVVRNFVDLARTMARPSRADRADGALR